MSNSIQKELEEIEYRRMMAQSDNRRGSSIFAPLEGGIGPYGRPAYLTTQGDDLVDEFSQNETSSSSQMVSGNMSINYQQSNSNDGVMISGSMNRGGDQFGNEEKKPRLGEAARMQQLANSQDLPGGKNHRPLVGGFAAAAYEAAKAHHYSSQKNSTQLNNTSNDRRLPPSI